MAETKIGLDQVNRPAPLWYRKLSNALIIFIVPGLSALIQGWGMADKLTNRWLLVLTFAPALLKGIGLILGNGQTYAVEKIAAVIITLLILVG